MGTAVRTDPLTAVLDRGFRPFFLLAGISGTVTIAAPGAKPAFDTTDGFLVTHEGWSGPSVLDASHLAIRGNRSGGRQELHVQWTALDAEAVLVHQRLATVKPGCLWMIY